MRVKDYYIKASKMKNLLLPLLFVLSVTVYSQNSELTVIGNKTGVPAQLTFSGLKSVFMGNQPKWSDGSKVVIAMMKFTTNAGKSTCSKLYQLSTAEVTKHWLTVSMKGTIDAPVFFNTSAELQNFVANTAGAIGIFDGTVNIPTVKIVLIDGRKSF
jgi:hypothetical protein